MRIRTRWIVAVAAIGWTAGCASTPGGMAGFDVGARGEGGHPREVEIVVRNDWTTVARVSILSAGVEVPLGRVGALQERRFTIPASNAPGIVHLVARPNAVLSSFDPHLSDPFPATPGDRIRWELHDRPAAAGYTHSTSALRIVGCGSPCR